VSRCYTHLSRPRARLVSVLGVLAVLWGGCQSAPAPSEGGPLHTVKLDSAPRGALVLEGDQILCRETPCVRAMTGGTHLVSFHLERYQPFELEVAPPSDRRVSAQLKPDFGTLDVRASKPLAVEVDGVALGKAPLKGVELEAGEHVLRVQDPCYKAVRLGFGSTRASGWSWSWSPRSCSRPSRCSP
jgi:hypothetical protein